MSFRGTIRASGKTFIKAVNHRESVRKGSIGVHDVKKWKAVV